MAEEIKGKKVFALSEVCKSISHTISQRYASSFYVKAQMHKLNFYIGSGHAFPELFEKKNDRIVAEMRAIIWSSDLKRIQKTFLSLLQEPLRDGISIFFEAIILYDPKYGLSLRILDIDPLFSLGEMEKEKIECVKKMKELGLWQKNKTLVLPALPKRFAIISAENSKGLSDFLEIMQEKSHAFGIDYQLFSAYLQGDKAVESILSQMRRIAINAENFDAVLLIRGGGGEIGLHCYNSFLLCKAVAEFPLPVLTGIGHSTNQLLVDEQAFYSASTPTALAHYLEDIYLQNLRNLDFLKNRLHNALMDNFDASFHLLNHQWLHLNNSVKLVYELKNRILKEYLRDLQIFTEAFFIKHKNNLQGMEKTIELWNPENLLKLGYSILLKNKEKIKSIQQIKQGDEIHIILQDGLAQAKILNTKNNGKK